MLDEQIKSLIKLNADIALTLLDKLPQELSKPLISYGRIAHEAIGEALSAHENAAPTPPPKSGSIPIE